jgi:large subunit ribosomal protein L21
MYAVVQIAGEQFKVSPNQKIIVPKLEKTVGEKLTFEQVLLLDNQNEVKVGNPFLSGVSVEATILQHFKDEKVLVYHKKRRKTFKKLRGHRQQFTEIEITKVG